MGISDVQAGPNVNLEQLCPYASPVMHLSFSMTILIMT